MSTTISRIITCLHHFLPAPQRGRQVLNYAWSFTSRYIELLSCCYSKLERRSLVLILLLLQWMSRSVKQGGLESSGQRIISLNIQTKRGYIYIFLFFLFCPHNYLWGQKKPWLDQSHLQELEKGLCSRPCLLDPIKTLKKNS